jgi:8-oxo-dGTP pyrophosphatase MutT (NUDIX family)
MNAQSRIGPEIILQKQYRPPIDKVVIEVPAGLVDAGESAEQAAVKELKEETGYVGVVTESSPVMFNGSGVFSPPTYNLNLLLTAWHNRPGFLQYEFEDGLCHN